MQSLFITDLDHTFLRSDLTLSHFTQKVWNDKSTQAILSIATARSYHKSLEFLSQIDLKAPLILLDGSMVVSPSKEMIDFKYINKTLGDAIIDEGNRFNILPFVIAMEDMQLNELFLYPHKVNAIQHSVLENYKGDPRMRAYSHIRAMQLNLKLVYFGELEILEPLNMHLQSVFGSELEYKLAPEKYTNGYFLTILHKDADKSHALSVVCEYLNQDLKNVTVFGDSLNDIGMFEIAGKAVAVANALDEVKAKADIVLPHTNDEDAVANYLSTISTHNSKQ